METEFSFILQESSIQTRSFCLLTTQHINLTVFANWHYLKGTTGPMNLPKWAFLATKYTFQSPKTFKLLRWFQLLSFWTMKSFKLRTFLKMWQSMLLYRKIFIGHLWILKLLCLKILQLSIFHWPHQ